MARPALPIEDRRTYSAGIRFNTAELVRAAHNAALFALPLATYGRALILEQPVVPPRLEMDRAGRAALARVGNLLNQIARHSNAGRGLPPEPVLHDLYARVHAILDQLYGPSDQQFRPDL